MLGVKLRVLRRVICNRRIKANIGLITDLILEKHQIYLTTTIEAAKSEPKCEPTT